MKGNPVNAKHKCQRCELHPVKWRAVSDIIDWPICTVCADLALSKYRAGLFDYDWLLGDPLYPLDKITIMQLESERKQ